MLPLLLLALAAVPVRVEAFEAGGAEAPALALAVSNALAVAGVPVLAGPSSSCGAGCARVRVRRARESEYEIEVVRPPYRRSARLAISEQASSFEAAHAVALRARALLEELPSGPARAPRRSAAPPASAPAPPPIAAPAPVPPGPPVPPPPAPVELAPVLPAIPPAAEPTRPALPEPRPVMASQPARMLQLAFGGGAAGSAGRANNLVAAGPSLWARAALGPIAAGRLSGSYLFSRQGVGDDGPYRAQLLSVALTLSGALPALPALRAGAGVELLRLAVKTSAGASGSALLVGPLVELEGRLPLGRLTLILLARGTLHRSDGIETDTTLLFHHPTVTLGVVLGVEFEVL